MRGLHDSSHTPVIGRRRLLFRCLAILLGLTPLLLAEAACRWMDWGRLSTQHDPFIGFGEIRPLFVLNSGTNRYEIPPARLDFFRPDSFAASKPPNEYRIFCLGGSTVQGNPYSTQTSFTTWLELALAAADPSRQFDVVNCGGISYASYRLTPILEEVLRYDPDLIVLYTGQNEFLEDRSLDHLQSRGPFLNTLLAFAAELRIFTLLQSVVRPFVVSDSVPPDRPLLPAEADARLDHVGGLDSYHRDVDWHRGVIAQYEFNLRRMIEKAERAGVPILLVNPVSNWRDQPPFKAEHRDGLAQTELRRWEELCASGSQALRGDDYDLEEAARCFEAACALDELHAGGWFNLAKCYDAMGRWDEAKSAYLKSKDLDVCPLRILQSMNQIVLRVADQTGVCLVDAQQLFESLSETGIVGGEWLADHVHPTIEGHQQLANAIFSEMVSHGQAIQTPGWEERRDQAYAANLDSLDTLYFLRGERHLMNLRYWTQGLVDERPPRTSKAK